MGFIFLKIVNLAVLYKIHFFTAGISSPNSLVHEASANLKTGEKTVSIDKYLEHNRSFNFCSFEKAHANKDYSIPLHVNYLP